MTPALLVDALACDRGGRTIFENVGFALRAHEALQVEGPNGAGKSSLLRQLGGLLRVAVGRIDNPFRTAWAGHEVALKPGMTLAAELAHWARLDGALPAAVAEAMAAFDLEPLGNLPAGVLSSGQRRRAALARVAASGAELWLLDEPGVGLDTRSLGLLADAMRAHRAAGGLIVAVTHSEIGLEAPQKLRLG